ncbi:uncharacterized protein [Anomalospiza imberbis]|uniref:uncharacterized protein isoform X5 n=1 Tax=Anomalospiza imberbis TaxID=187417 RepID=UPI00358FC934
MRVSSDRPFCPTPLPRIPSATGWQKSKLAPIYPSCLPLNTHKASAPDFNPKELLLELACPALAHSFLHSWYVDFSLSK